MTKQPNKQASDQEWKKVLTPSQYAVLRGHATELPYSGKYLYNAKAGTYVCAACGAALFDSDTKFEANCGWPSFYDAKPGAVELKEDTSYGMRRVEVRCVNCGGHLGHVFPDAPDQPTGQRYCINSISLNFTPKAKA